MKHGVLKGEPVCRLPGNTEDLKNPNWERNIRMVSAHTQNTHTYTRTDT